jgi:uncharacterized protein (DUF58 family)
LKDLIKKIRRLEIKIRRKVDSTFAGEYHSAFKGQGLEFDEVRRYQYGDDIRAIDWNVTAKTGDVYIKLFKEEREQTLFVLFDISGSEDFGPAEANKRLIGTEIASILAFSALKNNDKIGLATFTDQIEEYYKPKKGRKHILALVKGLLGHEPNHRLTRISTALEFARKTLKRRSILLVISDFLDKDYQQGLRSLAQKHELILIRLYHPDEVFRSSAGTVPIMDMERGQQRWIHAGDLGYRQRLLEEFDRLHQELASFCRRYRIGYIPINTQEDYLPKLERYFRQKNARKGQR